MNPSDIENLWQSLFLGIHPEADQLKVTFQSRWIRFHCLPGSKRYPDGPQEEALILSRHNAVLREIWPPDIRIVVIRTTFSLFEQPVPELGEPGWTYWRSFAIDPGETDTAWWHLFFDVKGWYEGILDEFILKASYEYICNLMVVDVDGRVLYHPYDGGMDLIFSEGERVPLIRSRFEAWLSPRPDGL